MPLPSDLTTITVTGTYLNDLGVPLAGQVTFTAAAVLQDSTGKVIFGVTPAAVPLNAAGSVSVTLPCTDNTNLNPTGFTYLVTEVIPGLGRAYWVSLPHTLGSTVDLSALAPVAAPVTATAFASANTWTATQTFSGNPGIKITTGAAANDVLTSDGSGNATWQPSSSGFSNPMTTLGDIIYENSAPGPARLAGNTSAAKEFLTQTGTGSASAAPAWGALQSGDIPNNAANTSGTAAGLSATLAIGSGGTGQTSQQAAMDALAGSQTSGDYLRGSGSHVVMSPIQAGDVPTLNQNTTGTAANITGTLDQVPAPAANVSLNSHKITSLANGSGAQDAAAFGQTVSGILTTLGDTIYENGTPAPARLAGNTTSTKNFLTQTGTGSVSAAPAWGTIASGDVPTLNQNTTGTAAGLSSTLAINSGGTGQTGAAAAYNALSPMTTKGDIEYDSAGGTAARLAVGAASGPTGDFLGVSGGIPAWQQVSGQYLCAPVSYTGSGGTFTTTSTTMAAVSSANVNTGSFTAPASGDVIVTASFVANSSNAGDQEAFGLCAHGTATPMVCNNLITKISTADAFYCLQFLVTGLSAGSSYNFDLMYAIAGAATLTVYYGANTSTTPTGASLQGPVVMTVQAV